MNEAALKADRGFTFPSVSSWDDADCVFTGSAGYLSLIDWPDTDSLMKISIINLLS